MDFLESIGTVPEDLRNRVISETDFDVLRNWIKLAAKADSIEQFIKEME